MPGVRAFSRASRRLSRLAQARGAETVLTRDGHRQPEIFLRAPALADRAAAFECTAAARAGETAGFGDSGHAGIMRWRRGEIKGGWRGGGPCLCYKRHDPFPREGHAQ